MTNPEIANVFNKYSPCDMIITEWPSDISSSTYFRGKKVKLLSVTNDFITIQSKPSIRITNLNVSVGKLLLRSIRSLTTIEIFNLCKLVAPEMLNNYKPEQWSISVFSPDIKLYCYANIKSKFSAYRFELNLNTGNIITFHADDIVDHNFNQTYWQWYFENNIEIPLYPYNKTAVELGLAIILNP